MMQEAGAGLSPHRPVRPFRYAQGLRTGYRAPVPTRVLLTSGSRLLPAAIIRA